MPNTSSAKKALRQSKRKQIQNLTWKKAIRDVVKTINKYLKDNNVSVAIIKEEERKLYKVVDKAAKNKVIHKNRASSIKSKLAKSIAAHEKTASEVKTQENKPTRSRKPKSKSA